MSENLKICLINDSFPPEIDGVANAVANYAEIISRSHGSATVVTPDNPSADDSVFPFPVLRYPSVDLTKFVGYYAGFPFSPDIQQALVSKNFSLIHSHCPITSTMLARSLRDRIDVPVVMTYHTKFDIDIANAISSHKLQEEAKKILVQNISACDEVWTVSRGAGENLRQLGYQGDYLVMPNGVDLPQGRVPDDLAEAAAGGLDLPQGVPVFLFVGRMMWYKGIRLILDALKDLLCAGQPFRMVFIGGGGDREEILAYARELGLTETVFFLEPIHDRDLIRAWYCRADLFLFPSTFDTNGLVVREAAACAMPSVLVRGSCAAEDVEDDVSGFLIEENARSLCEKLLQLCSHMEFVRAVGREAQCRLYLSWEDSVAAACRRYETVIENYRAGLYSRHEGLSDELIHGIAQSMDRYNRSRENQKAARRELEDSYRRLCNELREEKQRYLSEFQKNQNHINEEIDVRRGQLRSKFAEFAHYLDRFM